MKLTILPVENTVLRDGIPRTVDCTALREQGIHAIQWNESAGHIEYLDSRPNLPLLSIASYQSIIDAWQNAWANTPGMKLVNGTLVPKSTWDLYATGEIDLNEYKARTTAAVIAFHDQKIAAGYVDGSGRKFACDASVRRLLQEVMALGQYPQTWLTADRLNVRMLNSAADAQALLAEIMAFVAPIKQARYAKEVEIAQLAGPTSDYDVEAGWP